MTAPSPTALDDLIALRDRLTQAKASGRELNDAIHEALFPEDPWWQAMQRGRELVAAGNPDEIIRACGNNISAWSWAHVSQVPNYTGSHDAADQLVRRALPNWKLGTAAADPTRYKGVDTAWAKVEPYHQNDEGWAVGAFDARAATVPLSICAAVVIAKSALGRALRQEADHAR